MRTAWDLQAITGPRPTGLGVSVRLLLDALRVHQPQVEVVELRPNELNQPLRSVPDRLCWEQLRLPQRLAQAHRESRLDLLYSPALGAPLRCRLPVVAHVHDLISLRFPQQFTGFAGWYWKTLLPASWKRCRALTVSNASVRTELVELLGYPAERIHVVPYYPDGELAQIAGELNLTGEVSASGGEPLFITLASHEQRKNLELPIRALGELTRRGTQARLRCIGLHTAHTPSLQALAREEGVAELVDFPDYLSRKEVVAAMLGATALLFTSTYEGYGMPPQEAQSVGCPVLLSDIACHRAVYADSTRLGQLPPALRLSPPLIATSDSAGLAAEMLRLIEDSSWRSSLAEAGRLYSQTFSPQATAEALRSAFSSALSAS